MAYVPYVNLRDGYRVAMIGLGTWRSPPDVVGQTVKNAIDLGYRHIDCAHIYGNEKEVGEAVKEKINEGVVKREDLFITSKLWNTFHHPGMVKQAAELSLHNLQLDYLDNYLIHWPMAFKNGTELYPKDDSGKLIFSDVDYMDTWREMERLVESGLVHTIGLSNFNKEQITRIICEENRTIPTTLQIECHPYLNQSDMMQFCKDYNIVVTAYSPLGSGHSPYSKPGEFKLMEHPTIVNIAKRLDCSVAQVLLRYQVQRGNIVIPRSINKQHMESNLNIHTFELTPADIGEIDKLDCNGRFMTMESAAGHKYHPFP